MRKEPFSVDSYIHVYNRGNRKQEIVRDEKDEWRFLQMLRYFNDEYSPPNLFRELWKFNFHKQVFERLKQFEWPREWPEHDPLVKILAFSLMPNHFHLLLKEIKEGGTAKFMQKFGTGITNYFNIKYEEFGSLFQGSYKAKVVDKDLYLQDLSVYIQVKNPFELYPGGFKKAIKEFDKAYALAISSPFNSLADYMGKRNSPIIDRDVLGEIFQKPKEYEIFARDAMLSRDLDEKLDKLTLEY